jgi:hypothetical protein
VFENLSSYLTEGVQMHPFSDLSGCVFFNKHSGETLSVTMTLESIQLCINEYANPLTENRSKHVVHELMEKHFITI